MLCGPELSQQPGFVAYFSFKSKAYSFFLLFFVLFGFFKTRLSLCSPGCPGTCSVDQASLELRDPLASASWNAGSKGTHSTEHKLPVFGNMDKEGSHVAFWKNTTRHLRFILS